jgi:glutamine synthetase
MRREKLIFIGTSDLAGHLRGKAIPIGDLASRASIGVNMPPTNIMLSAFGPILTTPFGTAGELALVPDPATRVDVDFGPDDAGESFVLGDIRTPDGEFWECCPRHFLRRGLDALRAETGLSLLAAFEQEFYLLPVDETLPQSYRIESLRRSGIFGEVLIAALRAAGAEPDSFLAEYAPGQFEVTVRPTAGIAAADRAVIVRELLRAVAWRLGKTLTLAPVLTPDGVGSGTHVHLSFVGADGAPALYDPARPAELSVLGEAFVAGIATALPAIAALTAPAAASYFRLRPDKWAPTATSVALRDRGAAVRLCRPFSADSGAIAQGYNAEFRVADAAASPYLTLGAIVHAGLAGIRRQLTLPVPATALPHSLADALDALDDNATMRAAMGPLLHDIYRQFKRAEIESLTGLSPQEICDRYRSAY